MRRVTRFIAVVFLLIGLHSFLQAQNNKMIKPSVSRIPDNAFPAAVQFSPVPSGKGWKGGEQLLTPELQKETIDNIIDRGFSVLSIGNWSKKDQTEGNNALVKYSESRGMKINFITGGFEIFNREHAPAISVYSPQYQAEVKKKVEFGLASLKTIERVNSLFPFQDEPFHAGPEAFDYSEDAKAEFVKRYGYTMPPDLELVRNDPKKWLDLLNFQSNTFPDGWRQVYKIVKAFDPRPKIVLTHDSHSTFGGGVKSDAKIAMDDAFHWGGDFADVFIYDIYPYTMYDYRYGEPGKLRKPRISQMHYTISQLRNLTTTYGKELAFWVGTYNEAWFKRFMGPEMQRQYWGERELAYTAIAQGANFLITGIKIPSDSLHWENFGEGMNIVQKAGAGLLKAPKVKAKACFLFPRTQYLQLQEEYFNVGLSFELFLRSFGELDIIHEDQVTDDDLNGYKVLVLGDVKLLPETVAKHIEGFVKKGGIVIADCVPQMGEYKQTLNTMNQLFGVSSAQTDRILREGQWVPFTILPPKMGHAPPAGQKQEPIRTDNVAGKLFGESYGFKVVSPRNAGITNGKVRLTMNSGQPALISNTVGKGKVYLLGFCLQDTYFQTYKDSNEIARTQLQSLVSKLFIDAKVYPHIYSSNPDIEVTIRANADEGYLFVINHEATDPQTLVKLNDIGFQPGEIIDVETGKHIAFKRKGKTGELTIAAPFGTTRLLKILPRKR
ncbi:MAG: hypothetical protein JWP81_3979 [Ferruginibacter sp.]|nr:hypothetical protein [Ferruginibacter sp.]